MLHRLGCAQNMETLLQHYDTVLGKLLPALATAVASNHETGDTRFLCLKVLMRPPPQSARPLPPPPHPPAPPPTTYN